MEEQRCLNAFQGEGKKREHGKKKGRREWKGGRKAGRKATERKKNERKTKQNKTKQKEIKTERMKRC